MVSTASARIASAGKHRRSRALRPDRTAFQDDREGRSVSDPGGAPDRLGAERVVEGRGLFAAPPPRPTFWWSAFAFGTTVRILCALAKRSCRMPVTCHETLTCGRSDWMVKRLPAIGFTTRAFHPRVPTIVS